MKALITGASSGIGLEMAYYLASKNIDLILVARRKDRLLQIQEKVNVNVEIFDLDLSKQEHVYALLKELDNEDIDIVINNAGFGLLGEFTETDLDRELEMIQLNITTLHILTKHFLQQFKAKDQGYILNVASAAGFLPGPKLATYYATKNYVLRLSQAIYEELRQSKSKVTISVLCPGPVNTEFEKVAQAKFNARALDTKQVARYAIDQMFNHKLVIIPGFQMKFGLFLRRIVSDKSLMKILYKWQNKR